MVSNNVPKRSIPTQADQEMQRVALVGERVDSELAKRAQAMKDYDNSQ